jgi:hypothetical protein
VLNKPVKRLLKLENFSGLPKNFEAFTSLPEFKASNQICITSKSGEDLFGATGAIWDMHKKNIAAHTSDFTVLNSVFRDSLVSEVFDFTKEYVEKNFRVRLGRVRFMRLSPKTCYSYHIDDAEFRFHIPLNTNQNCFFVVADEVYRMDLPFYLYKLETSKIHTAVNASFEIRDHLVFDTYK